MGNFSEQKIQEVWEKGMIVPGYNEDKVRKDACSAWMKREEYGNIESNYGWEIDHTKPESKGGSSDLSNLRPMQWSNNRNKGDDYPEYIAVVKSEGNKNVNKEQHRKIS